MKELSELFLLEYFGIKVIIATICGLIVGIERERKDKVAGIRTNVLVCVGVAIMTAASFLYGIVDSDVDSTRIIGQIITGVGFLGAGVIFKNNDKVVGVTTASFIWIMSAIGILAGSGFILVPIVLTIGLVIISLLFEKLEKFVKK
jgi:putative Mg2+ transporter-C (MgtC) family protein